MASGEGDASQRRAAKENASALVVLDALAEMRRADRPEMHERIAALADREYVTIHGDRLVALLTPLWTVRSTFVRMLAEMDDVTPGDADGLALERATHRALADLSDTMHAGWGLMANG